MASQYEWTRCDADALSGGTARRQFRSDRGANAASPGRLRLGLFLDHPPMNPVALYRQELAGLNRMVAPVVFQSPVDESPNLGDVANRSENGENEDDGARTRNLRRDRPVL